MKEQLMMQVQNSNSMFTPTTIVAFPALARVRQEFESLSMSKVDQLAHSESHQVVMFRSFLNPFVYLQWDRITKITCFKHTWIHCYLMCLIQNKSMARL
jgi:hypothetical protein